MRFIPVRRIEPSFHHSRRTDQRSRHAGPAAQSSGWGTTSGGFVCQTSYGTMLTLDTDDEANSKTENEAAERKSLIFSIATYVNFVSIYNIYIYIININNNNNQNITNNTIQYILHSLVLSIPALIGA